MGSCVLILKQEWSLKKMLSEKSRLEASGVVRGNGSYYVVFDNLHKVAKIKEDFPKGSKKPAKKPTWVNTNRNGPGFEDIAYDKKNHRFFLLVEAHLKDSGTLFAKIDTFTKEFRFYEWKWVNFPFSHQNKGFEGLEHIQRRGKDYLLALCEGNQCMGGGKSEGLQVGGEFRC